MYKDILGIKIWTRYKGMYGLYIRVWAGIRIWTRYKCMGW